MKKILTITSAIIVLWAVLTFTISSQTQKEFQHYIDSSNRIYIRNGIKLTLSDYQKSFLGSTATMEIDVIDPKIAKEIKKDLILPIKVHYTIEHGPLLFKNEFGLGLSKINSDLQVSSLLQPKVKKEFLELVKEDINLKTNMVISFAKNLHYTIESDAVHITQDNKDFTMTPLSFKGTTHIETLKGDGKLLISEIKFKEKESNNGINIKELAFDIKIDEFIDNNLIFGEFKLSMANMLIIDDANPAVKKISITLDAKMNSKRVNETMMDSSFQATVDLKDTELPTEYKTLQNIQLAMNLKDLGIKGMSEFQQVAQKAQKEQAKLLEKLQSSTAEEMQPLFNQFNTIQEQMVTNIIHSLNNLLIKDKTSIAYSVDIKTEDKASTKALAEVGYTGDIEFKGTAEELTKKIESQMLSLIRLNVDIELNKKHIKLLPVPMLKQQLQMGVAQGFVKENNSSFSLNGYYKDKQLMVNDNNLTATVLPLLMMLTAR